ncbi:MAG: peptidoglycan-binding domain-containing protein, partial [Albidovulum sp.]|uniref:peptidoglycan-binding domain-containing protein n=1 Tax=Albidovulum sp. TaxID=1872424 RepID=UPI003CA24C1F
AALIDDGLVPGKGPPDAAAFLYQALRAGSFSVLDQLVTRPTMFKRDTRKALQAELARNGFYDGPLDADVGPGTQRAIRTAYGLEQED